VSRHDDFKITERGREKKKLSKILAESQITNRHLNVPSEYIASSKFLYLAAAQ